LILGDGIKSSKHFTNKAISYGYKMKKKCYEKAMAWYWLEVEESAEAEARSRGICGSRG
jgi:hypothetical protein